jgi:biopolymer transport protein ExbB/TolQ
MDNLSLFIVGLVVAIPTLIVVTALVFAAGMDGREKERQRRGVTAASAG